MERRLSRSMQTMPTDSAGIRAAARTDLRNRLRLLASACVCAGALAPALAAPPPAAEREIAALIAELGRSGCRFERNGTWYDAATARAHLQKKYDYLRKRDLVNSAEQFIARGASESSMSGKPYRVQCAPQPATPAAAWFKQRLAAIRAAASAPAAKPATTPASTAPAPPPAARKP
jgi:hypothetical protein